MQTPLFLREIILITYPTNPLLLVLIKLKKNKERFVRNQPEVDDRAEPVLANSQSPNQRKPREEEILKPKKA